MSQFFVLLSKTASQLLFYEQLAKLSTQVQVYGYDYKNEKEFELRKIRSSENPIFISS